MCSILNFLFFPHVHRALTKWPGSTIGQCQGGGFITCIEYHHNFQLFPPFFFNSTSPVQPISSSCPHNWSMSGRRFDPLYRGVPSQPTAAFQFTFYFCHNYLPQPPSFTNTNTLLPSNSLFIFTTITYLATPRPQIQIQIYSCLPVTCYHTY